LTTVSGPLPDSWRAFVVMPTLVMCHWPGASCVQPFAMMLALIAVVSAAPVTSPDGCSRTAAPPPALPHADASPEPVATGTCPAVGVPDGSGMTPRLVLAVDALVTSDRLFTAWSIP